MEQQGERQGVAAQLPKWASPTDDKWDMMVIRVRMKTLQESNTYLEQDQ